MAMDVTAFGIGETPEESAGQPGDKRRRTLPTLRRKAGGLAALASGTDIGDDDLSKEPLGEGDLSSPIATPGLSGKPGEPSLLATERVERAPASFSAQPLLGREDRAGAAFGEAERGEEGTLGGGTKAGLSTSARNKALISFFRPQSAQSGGPDSRTGEGIVRSVAGMVPRGAQAAKGLRQLFD